MGICTEAGTAWLRFPAHSQRREWHGGFEERRSSCPRLLTGKLHWETGRARDTMGEEYDEG
jgi:sigma54-dependent transcription regulator